PLIAFHHSLASDANERASPKEDPKCLTSYISFLRFAISSSVVPVVTNSYSRAEPTLGRRIRPRRWMYSRLVLLPLTIMATRQSGTSTPSLSTRPVTSLVYCPERKRSRIARRSSVGVL